jgi:hypothetical protein
MNILYKLLALVQQEKIVVNALEELNTEMKKRIYGRGKASDGTDIGLKADGTKSYMHDKGNLENSQVAGKKGTDHGIGWSNPESKKIADINSARFQKEIFAPTREEILLVRIAIVRQIKESLFKR